MVRGPALISRGASAVRKRGALAKGPARPPLWPALCMPYVSSGQLQTVKLQFNKTESSYLLFLECSPQNSCFFLCAGKIAGFVCVDAARKKNS